MKHSNSTNPSRQPTPQPFQTAADLNNEIVRLSRHTIDLLNARAYDDPFFQNHVSPSVYTNYNDQQVGWSREGFIAAYRRDADVNPDFFCDVERSTAVADEAHGTATTISNHVAKGFEDERMRGKRRVGSTLWHWSKVDGRWLLQSCSIMMGAAEFVD
ncbi:uncharacterized protein LTR77_007777 [Saxophila tyrrhenica]|uniref:SnoaL-like domain-containing protein n=1 Tax=Saxophila tyrrhenica TaxID=1690608 RepID=A0AAV9P6Z2_9PEZI|nr:hypothetical protein LTR77_007777 [Saxophila tyrrhenica]